MKTILHLIETSGPGGAEKMLMSLVENLNQKAYRSVICLLKDGWLNTQLRQRGIETVLIPQSRGLDPGWLYKCVRLIRQKEVDLVHAHEFNMNVYGCMAAWFSLVPSIATVHGKGYYIDRWRRKMAYRAVANHSFRMVAVSENVRQFLIEQVGAKPDKLTTIYNGIDRKRFLRSEDGVQLRRELGIPETTPVIGAIGNLYPVKGHTYLVKAAAHVVERFPEAVFLFAGRGVLLTQLQHEVDQLGLTNSVKFLGFREDIPALLQALDIFVLPSLSEGLPLSLLEAMASSKPAVATNVGGTPEVLVNEETGYLVPPMDHESLASRLLALLSDKAMAKRMGANGRNRVCEKFLLETMVSAYEALYEAASVRK